MNTTPVPEVPSLTKAKVSELIKETIINKKISYIDAIVHICETHNIEIESISKYISPIIKDKLQSEAVELNYLPKEHEINF
jgi:UDP-glucose 6-dehydrogenase